ncbi:MAG: hypothetical protein U5L95_00140 [Candidatus Saccharibacteria bacterium]|nr:hypothetical protein [Candidatus Saccharibacteria bacterium]
MINHVTAKEAAGHIARVNLEDEERQSTLVKKRRQDYAPNKPRNWPKSRSKRPGRSEARGPPPKVVYLDAALEEKSVIAAASEELDGDGYFAEERVERAFALGFRRSRCRPQADPHGTPHASKSS